MHYACCRYEASVTLFQQECWQSWFDSQGLSYCCLTSYTAMMVRRTASCLHTHQRSQLLTVLCEHSLLSTDFYCMSSATCNAKYHYRLAIQHSTIRKLIHPVNACLRPRLLPQWSHGRARRLIAPRRRSFDAKLHKLFLVEVCFKMLCLIEARDKQGRNLHASIPS